MQDCYSVAVLSNDHCGRFNTPGLTSYEQSCQCLLSSESAHDRNPRPPSDKARKAAFQIETNRILLANFSDTDRGLNVLYSSQ